jgi:hypothetical protein
MSCTPLYSDLQPVQADAACLAKFKPAFRADWYNASVDVVGNHISGLLLFKSMPDSSVRIVFTNEVGLTFFDFEYTKQGKFTVHQVIEKLNKKAVINLLRKDFELIMMRDVGEKPLKSFSRNTEILYAVRGKKETDYFITDKDCASLLRIEKNSKRKKKTEVRLIGAHHQAPDSVFLKHFTFAMQLRLKKLHR